MDWFETLLNTGNIALQTAGQVGIAQANADAYAKRTAAEIEASQRAFTQNLILKQTGNQNAITSPNMILIVMIGVAALFVINQANK